MPASDIEISREKSFDYLAESKRLVEEGKWGLAMVAIHQHCELLLKYYALKLNNSYPRAYSLRELIRLLVKHKKELNDLINNEYNILKLARLEDVYISSRYFPVRASEQDVVPLVRFVEDVFDECLSGL